jgi:ADP-ribose pyrophosphatase
MREEIINALKEYKTICLEQKGKNKFITVETYNCTLVNGKKITREKILKNKNDGNAAIILPITKEGKIIIAIEPRVFTKNTVGIDLPAGYIEKNEKPVEAAKRELLEETGYTTDKFIPMGSFYQDQGCSAALNHYFIAKDCKKVKEQQLDEGEFIKYVLVDMEELDELLRDGYITGLNSAYLIEKGRKYVRRK